MANISTAAFQLQVGHLVANVLPNSLAARQKRAEHSRWLKQQISRASLHIPGCRYMWFRCMRTRLYSMLASACVNVTYHIAMQTVAMQPYRLHNETYHKQCTRLHNMRAMQRCVLSDVYPGAIRVLSSNATIAICMLEYATDLCSMSCILLSRTPLPKCSRRSVCLCS